VGVLVISRGTSVANSVGDAHPAETIAVRTRGTKTRKIFLEMLDFLQVDWSLVPRFAAYFQTAQNSTGE
jgi:hypothetical protein